MNFEEKYCMQSEKDKPENKDKKSISDDSFALGEVLDEIQKEIKILGLKK
jgi:hypothetical protein